jgi:hypothetical protein
MSTQLLERPKPNVAPNLIELENSAPAVDDRQFRTITDDECSSVSTDLFYRHQCAVSRVAVSGAALGVGVAALSAGAVSAAPGGGTGGAGVMRPMLLLHLLLLESKTQWIMIKAVDGIASCGFWGGSRPNGFMLCSGF